MPGRASKAMFLLDTTQNAVQTGRGVCNADPPQAGTGLLGFGGNTLGLLRNAPEDYPSRASLLLGEGRAEAQVRVMGWPEAAGTGPEQVWTADLSHLTGKTAAARNRAIQAVINEDLPRLRLTFMPEYDPFIRTGLANPGVGTRIGRNMFSSRRELRNTIIHEELHHRWWSRGRLSPHHASEYVPNERFYEVIRRFEQMRGWRYD
jgi:hypothetical protein